MYQNLFILAVFAFMYGLITKRIETSYISGPILFVAFGFIAGPYGLGLLDLNVNGELLSKLAEFTLALVLFNDASMLNVKVVKKYANIPRQLLMIGLPLSIVLGFLAALLIFPEFTWIEALILGVILAPTDAALGKPVVNNSSIPDKIRTSLNVESGLNDGICVPILLICFTVNANLGTGSPIAQFGIFIKTIGVGILVGACLAYMGNFLIKKAIDLRTSADSWTRVIVIALTIMILTIAELLGGSGFIACFTGGAVFGYLARRNKLKLEIAAEGVGEILSLATWVLFGSIVVAKFFSAVEVAMVLYAVLSLTVIRMLPVSISLIRQKVNRKSRMFIGWFGPRGLASIVFIVMALDQNLPHMDTIVMAAVGTILMSIVLHGVTANAIVNRYAQYLK